MPRPPAIDICAINVKESLLVCVNTVDTNKVHEVKLENANNYISLSPDHYLRVKEYIEDMKVWLKKNADRVKL
jgi:hypothetical protein